MVLPCLLMGTELLPGQCELQEPFCPVKSSSPFPSPWLFPHPGPESFTTEANPLKVPEAFTVALPCRLLPLPWHSSPQILGSWASSFSAPPLSSGGPSCSAWAPCPCRWTCFVQSARQSWVGVAPFVSRLSGTAVLRLPLPTSERHCAPVFRSVLGIEGRRVNRVPPLHRGPKQNFLLLLYEENLAVFQSWL